MTVSLLISAVVGVGVVCTRLGWTVVLLVVSYLALRRSKPDERKDILEALGPVLTAIGPAPAIKDAPSGKIAQGDSRA